MQYSNSHTGYPLTATVEVGGYQSSVKLKGKETWSGTANHTASGSFTVSGLSASTSALSTYLKVTSSSGNVGGTMSWVQGSNLDIPTIAQRSIGYSLNGGSGSFATQYKYDGYSISLHSGKPTRSNSTSNGYTVTFNANSGTTSKTSQTAVNTTSYSFSSWYSSADGKYYSPGATYSYNANTTMTAQWSSSTSKGSVTLPTASQCTRANYNLLGWSTSSSATSASYLPGATFTPSSSVTLYAVWELANGKSTFSLSNNEIKLDTSTITMNLSLVISSNTHTITLTIADSTYTLATGVGSSHSFTLPASSYASLFPNSESTTGTITATTYSNGSSLGSYSESVTIILPESLGKPGKPSAEVTSKTSSGATIKLTKPTTFKYGAIFKEWQVTSNIGEISVSGNIATGTIDPSLNKTAVATIRAVDSRGFISDPVSVQWHKRISGSCVYDSGLWKNATKYIYYKGAWVKVEDAIYNNYNWYYSDGCTVKLVDRMLISSDNYILNSSDGYTLKGKRG